MYFVSLVHQTVVSETLGLQRPLSERRLDLRGIRSKSAVGDSRSQELARSKFLSMPLIPAIQEAGAVVQI